MKVRLYEDGDRERWNEYAGESSLASNYHQLGWKDIIEKSFGHSTYYLLAEDDRNDVKGILPLVQIKSALFGNFIVSLPYFNYGGVCADDDGIGGKLLSEAVCIAEKNGAEHLELRHTRNISNDLSVKTVKVSMLLSLPVKYEDLWDSFSSKLRSQIRRPTKEGMFSKVGGVDELDNFYSIFSVNMRDLGTPLYSKSFFRNIFEEFPESTHICTVFSKDGKPVASGFLAGFKQTLEMPWASSLRAYNRYSPNMLLYWDVMKYACENGYTIFDAGRSTPGEGTYKFKEQWGAKPLQLYWHYWMKNGGPPARA